MASAMKEARMFEDVGFHDFKISVKHHDVVTMVQTYRLLASKGDWPLHLGVTEAGPTWQGTIKSCLAFGALLAEGIGDTIRVSLSAPPVEEVRWAASCWNTWDCARVSSTSSPARPAAVPRWT